MSGTAPASPPSGPRPGRPPVEAAAGIARWLPGVDALRHYQRPWLRGDVLAGLTVAAYLVPQCMAYARVAGLPPVAGLWAMLAPLVLYALVGSSRLLSVGPETTTAIMTASAVAPLAAGDPSRYAALAAGAALVVGAVCLLASALRLGFLANLLSKPILVGYMAGVALIMIVGQLDNITGVPTEGDTAVAELRSFVDGIGSLDTTTAVLAGAVLVFLFAMQHWAPRWPGPLVAVLLSAGAVALLGLEDLGVDVVGTIPAGLPVPSVPDLAWADVRALLVPAVGIALVGYSDNVLTARGFAARHDEHVDADRELTALGVSNLGAGVLSGFPISSSGSRTALAESQGAASQAYSLVALLGVLAVLFVFRPVLEAFPDAALGALVTYAAIKLVELPEFVRLLRFRRSELAIAVATLVGVLVTDILIGVLVAVLLSAADLLLRMAVPHDAVLGRVDGMEGWHDVDDWPAARTVPGLVVYRYDAPLFYANVEDFRANAEAAVRDAGAAGPVRWFVLQCEGLVRIDMSGADTLVDLVGRLERWGVVTALCEVKQELRSQLERGGVLDAVGPDRVFETVQQALAAFRAETGAAATGETPAVDPARTEPGSGSVDGGAVPR